MAIDALAGYLFTAKLDKEPIPAPSEMKAIDASAVAKELEVEPGEYFVNMVAVDVDEYARTHFIKSVKKTLSVPAWLNEMAAAKGINFSQVLQEGLKARLGI